MSNDLGDFQAKLERELVGAAYRMADGGNKSKFRLSRFTAPVLAAMILVVALVGLNVTRSNPAAARVFMITPLEDRTELAVIDIVTNPDDVINQLSEDLGIEAQVFALPVGPELVGQIIGIGTSGSVSPEVEFNSDRTIDTIILGRGYAGDLLIEYGRPANGNETYVATVPDQICATLWGQTPAQSRDAVQPLAKTIRYDLVHADLKYTSDTPDEVPGDYKLIVVEYLSVDTVIVTYAANTDAQPRHPNCQ